MKIYILADISSKDGYGHLIRTYTLSSSIKKKFKSSITYVSDNISENINFFFKKKKIFTTSYKSFEKLKVKKNILIIDTYRSVKKSIKDLVSNNYVIYFNDFNTINRIKPNLIVNNNLNLKNIKLNKKKVILLYGPKYFILRDEIKTLKPKNKLEKIKNIYITFGGSKVKKTILTLFNDLNFFCQLIGGKINIYVNSNFNKSEISSCFNLNKKINLKFINLNPFKKFKYNKIDMSINSGGLTSIEMIYLNIPQICIKLSDNQNKNTNFISKKKIGTIGYKDNNNYKNLFKKYLINYKKYFKNLKKNKIIESKGTERLVFEVIKDIKKKKYEF